MWLFFTLATTLLWGAAELFYKKGSHEDQKYDHLRVCILVGAVMGVHAVFTLLTSGVAYDPANLIAYLPVSLCYILSMACSFFGIRFIEESLADPIENTAGAMCSIFCVIFLGERIAPAIWAAIAVIVVGVIGVSYMENTHWICPLFVLSPIMPLPATRSLPASQPLTRCCLSVSMLLLPVRSWRA